MMEAPVLAEATGLAAPRAADVPAVEHIRAVILANLSKISTLFRSWDQDDSGTIDKKEFRQALPVIGLRVARADADSLFEELDTDASGTISYAEFLVGLERTLGFKGKRATLNAVIWLRGSSSRGRPPSPCPLLHSAHHWLRELNSLGLSPLQVWQELDDDGSGFITAKEFGPFMKSGMGDPGPTWKERRQADKDALARS